MSQDKYQALSTDKPVIRVLTLEPSTDPRSLIVANLCEGNLERLEESAVTSYEALSYAWGDPTLSQTTVTLNGYSHGVTSNLDAALRQLRHSNQKRNLWIDALCINQNDVAERSSQVRIMRRIYGCAERVMIWLGLAYSDEDDIERSLQFVTSLQQENIRRNTIKLLSLKAKARIGSTSASIPAAIFTTDPDKFAKLIQLAHDLLFLEANSSPPKMRAAIHFFSSPWFCRMWVQQEVLAARKLSLMYGKQVVEWETMTKALGTLVPYPNIQALFRDLAGPRMAAAPTYLSKAIHMVGLRKQYQSIGSVSFEILVRYARRLDTTDVRDRIFGILGVSDVAHKLDVDYSMTTRDVLVRATTLLLQESDSLNMLDACGSLTTSDIPSWVIDLADPSPITVLSRWPVPVYQASRSRRAQYTIKKSPALLHVRGAVISSIHSIAIPLPANGDEHEMLSKWLRESHDFVETMSKAHRPESTPTSTPSLFLRILVADQGLMGRRLELPVENNECHDQSPEDAYAKLMGPLFSASKKSIHGQQLLRVCSGRVLMATKSGHFGITTSACRVGDQVCILFGAQVPFVLRRTSAGRHVLVGEAYVHGIMDGEAMDDLDRGMHEECEFSIE